MENNNEDDEFDHIDILAFVAMVFALVFYTLFKLDIL